MCVCGRGRACEQCLCGEVSSQTGRSVEDALPKALLRDKIETKFLMVSKDDRLRCGEEARSN